MQTQEGMVNEGIALNDGLDFEASTYENTSIEQQDETSSSGHVVDAEREGVDKVVSGKENVDVRPSSDNNTLTEVSREDQQANAFLTKELKRYKEKGKHFAKETTNESEYCKKIKFLNEEISNLKSQVSQKEKSFHKENEKYAEWIPTGKTVGTCLNTNDSATPLGKETCSPNTIICANSSSLSAGTSTVSVPISLKGSSNVNILSSSSLYKHSIFNYV
nr:hypothetical protein [Tanacetum cinerariifolium]